MAEEFELKRISVDGVDAAISRAERYRLLNQPVQARSICHDVLAVDPDNQRALVVLVLAITDEFKSGACHAGSYESSVILAARPELVRDEIRLSLPPNPVSIAHAIREGKKTFEEAGGDEAYFGDPAAASAEEGHQTLGILGEILAEAVLEERETSAPSSD